MFGDGRQTRDFVFVEDVVGAFVVAAEATGVGRAFNVGTGRRRACSSSSSSITVNYRESYDMPLCSGILFNTRALAAGASS